MNRIRVSALLRYMKGYKWLLGIGLIFMGAELFVSFVTPLFMSVTIDSVIGGEAVNVPDYFRWFITLIGGESFISADVLRSLIILAASALLFRLIGGLLTFARTYVNSKASEGTIKRLRDRFYAHVQRLPFRYHATVQTGDLIQRATGDLETIRRFISGTVLELIRTVMLFAVGIFVMANLHVPLTFITLVMGPFIVATSFAYFKGIQKQFQEIEEEDGKLYTVMQENLTGIRVVRAFARQPFELNKFRDINDRLFAKNVRICNTFAWLWSTLDLISGLQFTLVMGFGIYFSVNGSLTLGEFVAFTGYIWMFIWPLRNFGRLLSDLGRSLIAVGRVEEVLNEKEEDPVADGVTPPLSGDIAFEDVVFGYDETSQVLKELSLTIKGGSTVAFLGGTGSGKSTLAQLLQRLYELNGGRITIGGVDITEMQKAHLRGRIGIVLQEPFLYSKSIKDNIGIKLETPDMERIIEAASVAAVHADISGFDDGYDTLVGERGVTLSGGQKQRVAIARALMSDSDILIFDDSLSAVDSKTDAQIRAALKERRVGTTTLIISHRITTLMEADRIFVLKDGRVVEQGSHDELVKHGGIYRRTYDIQSAQNEEVSA